MITHACFFSLPYFPNKSWWTVIFDESPSIYDAYELRLPETHQVLTDHLTVAKSASVYGCLEVTNKTAVKRISDNDNDDEFFAKLQGIARNLLNNNIVNWVKTVEFDKLIRNEKDRTNLLIHAIVKPSIFEGFEKVTIAAAGFEKTLMYHVWSDLGVEWTVDEEITTQLLRPLHPYNPTVTIFYGYDQGNSKELRKKLIARGDEHLRLKTIGVMQGDPFIWSENKDYKALTIFKDCENGEELPGTSHGLNKYQHIHHAAILGAYNFRKDQSAFLNKVYGFDREMQRESMNLQIYQNVMRGSIRNDNVTDAKKIVVTSRLDAELLHQMLPGSIIQSLDIPQLAPLPSGPKRKHATDNDRKRASERRKATDTVLRTRFADILSPDFISRSVMWNESDESSYTSIDQLVRNFRGSYFTQWKDTNPQIICMNEDDWNAKLKHMHTNSYESKHEIHMISGALFNASRENGSVRQYDNVEFVRDVWLDFEEGDLKFDQFASLFPTVSMTIYNSYRHTRSNPRFRVRALTNRPMQKHEYQSIYHEIEHVLHQSGYRRRSQKNGFDNGVETIKYSGLDYRPNPSLLSGLPCQAQDPKESFYEDYFKDRKPLDVSMWLKQSSYVEGATDHIPLPTLAAGLFELSTKQVEGIQSALQEWSIQTAQRGNGNHALFHLWLSLCRLVLPYPVVEQELMTAARSSPSASDRIAQAKRLLRNTRVKL